MKIFNESENKSYNFIELFLNKDEALQLFNNLFLLLNQADKSEICIIDEDSDGDILKKIKIVKKN